MTQRSLVALVLGACAILLIGGVVFSTHVTDSIAAAAHREATQQSPVPVPAALAHAKVAPTATKPAPSHA